MKRVLGILLIAICLSAGGFLLRESAAPPGCAVFAEDQEIEVTENGEEAPDGERLVVTVVEDREVETLEEYGVPLASIPKDRLCATHALLALVVLLMTIGYVIYFSRYQKRLHGLKERAAVLEQRLREEDRHVL